MEIPIINYKVNVTDIAKAVDLANELIEKINAAKLLANELNGIMENLDFKIEADVRPEDT